MPTSEITIIPIALKLVLNRSLEHLVRETESEVGGGGKDRKGEEGKKGEKGRERRDEREWREGEG